MCSFKGVCATSTAAFTLTLGSSHHLVTDFFCDSSNVSAQWFTPFVIRINFRKHHFFSAPLIQTSICLIAPLACTVDNLVTSLIFNALNTSCSVLSLNLANCIALLFKLPTCSDVIGVT